MIERKISQKGNGGIVSFLPPEEEARGEKGSVVVKDKAQDSAGVAAPSSKKMDVAISSPMVCTTSIAGAADGSINGYGDDDDVGGEGYSEGYSDDDDSQRPGATQIFSCPTQAMLSNRELDIILIGDDDGDNPSSSFNTETNPDIGNIANNDTTFAIITEAEPVFGSGGNTNDDDDDLEKTMLKQRVQDLEAQQRNVVQAMTVSSSKYTSILPCLESRRHPTLFLLTLLVVAAIVAVGLYMSITTSTKKPGEEGGASKLPPPSSLLSSFLPPTLETVAERGYLKCGILDLGFSRDMVRWKSHKAGVSLRLQWFIKSHSKIVFARLSFHSAEL